MKTFALESPKKLTARRRVAGILSGEILSNSETKDFPIASEYQLCRRFSVSRVTVRLALSDLQHKGLIYRRHGKGTFAHGSANRTHRSLGIFLKSPDALSDPAIVEFIRGAQTAATCMKSSLVLVSTSPLDWRAEMTNSLGGVIVMHDCVSGEELDAMQRHKLTIICVAGSELTTCENESFNLGRCTATSLYRPSITGEVDP